jgi:hypothetical protein
MIPNQKFRSTVCSSAINRSMVSRLRRLAALALTLVTLNAGLLPPLSITQLGPLPVFGQNSADGTRIGPNLDDFRAKRQQQRDKADQDLNTPASGPLGLQRQPNLSDLFPSIPLGLTIPQPISLEGIKIPGLNNKSVETLAYNQFMVVHGNSFNFPNMADLYRDNRVSGRSNFISSDVITHLYFVIMNTIYLKVVEDTLCGELETLLKELMDSCVHDYRACDIAEVKDDIQRNLSFVIVGMKLLNPKAELPDMGGASDLARAELAVITKGGKGHSLIFNRDQDFASLRPIGYFATTAKSANFFRAASWLSVMYFPLADVTNNSETGGGNTFRRAVLLYRALELGKTKDDSETLLSRWQHIIDIYSIVTMGRITREPSVYPRDLRSMFSAAGKLDFKDLLYTLAQPLTRARLLLSIKKQRQMGLNATSIFEIGKQKEADESAIVFRFLPPITPYEADWLRYTVKDFRDDGTSGGQYVNPLSLYILYAWGAAQASNLLKPMVEHLDPSLYFGLGELLRTEGRRQRQTDPEKAFQYPERRWSIISDYFVPVKKGSQAILYSDFWMTQRLSSASGAFVDSLIAIDKSYKSELVPSQQVTGSIAPGGTTTTGTLTAAQARVQGQAAGAPTNATAAAGSPAKDAKAASTTGSATGSTAAPATATAATAAAATAAPTPARAAKPPPVPIFHYLEPCPDYYRKLSAFLLSNENELARLGAFPQAHKGKVRDFVRLLDRLVKICDKEVAFEALPAVDFQLMAHFDEVLAAVDSPLAGSFYIPGVSGGGASLGLGDAGVCYIIFNTDKGPYLSRGAVYTYYEVAGGPFKAEHWERKKSFGFLRPSSWMAPYDFVQEGPSPGKPKDTKDAK